METDRRIKFPQSRLQTEKHMDLQVTKATTAMVDGKPWSGYVELRV